MNVHAHTHTHTAKFRLKSGKSFTIDLVEFCFLAQRTKKKGQKNQNKTQSHVFAIVAIFHRIPIRILRLLHFAELLFRHFIRLTRTGPDLARARFPRVTGQINTG